MNPLKGETVTSIYRINQRKNIKSLPLIDMVKIMIARAIRLKISIRLCRASLIVIFLDVVLASVINTIAMIMAVLCSTNQYLMDGSFIASPENCTAGLTKNKINPRRSCNKKKQAQFVVSIGIRFFIYQADE